MALINHTKGARLGPLKIFIAIPTYSGKLDGGLTHSLIESLALLEKEEIGYEFFTLSYNCHVDDARNAIVSRFLQSECDALVFIDADVSWKPESLVRLAKHDRDIVAGVYPKRCKHDLEFPVTVEPGVDLYADEDGLVSVTGAPTGFMKIKRHVLEKMVLKNKHRQYKNRISKPDDPVETIIFERTYENGNRYGGDIAFCRNWQKMGGKVFVDPEMKLTHTGEIHFSGTLGDFWREKHGVSGYERQVKFKKAIEQLRSGKCTEQDVNWLNEGWGSNPFSASSEMLAACYWMAKEAKGSILETGSGLSTIVMALANPDLTIHCMEHDILWASKLKYTMDIYGITNIKIHLNDLKEYQEGKWYDATTLPDESFSMAVCDGPPRRISNRSLFYKMMNEKIKGATVLMDDADDEIALGPIRQWAKGHGRGEVEVLGSGNRRFAISRGI